jgi:hypothetical protein
MSAFVRAIAIPGGMVIVGEANRRPAAWSSTDLVTWTPELMAGRGALPIDAVPFLDGVLALGLGDDTLCAHPVGEDSWFRGPAGVWVEAAHQEVFCAGGSPSVAVAGSTAIIVGTGSGDQPFGWTSDDGLTWVDSHARFPEEPPFAAVSVGGIGFVSISQTFGTGSPWVARSDTGVGWRFEQPFDVPPGAAPTALASANGQTLALYTLDDGSLVGFLSLDQQHWERVDLGPLAGARTWQLAENGGQFAAVGIGPPASLFLSDNGRQWQAVALPANLPAGWYPSIIGSGPSDQLVLAVNPPDNGGQAQVWISGPPGLAH